MKLVKARSADGGIVVGILEQDRVERLDIGPSRPISCLSALLEQLPGKQIDACRANAPPVPLSDLQLLVPIDDQEVWAAGVTYRRSRTARMEESEGAAQFYDKIYQADRPELFFKATPHRVVGPNQGVRIRRDARWNVPEPELALVINSKRSVVGFTIGNDMSSRDIEGENPLYLPQAKVYDACCALGPAILLAEPAITMDRAAIALKISRNGQTVFAGEANTAQMARGFADLVDWLWRETTFPSGVILLTGTGIIPPDDFTLEAGDNVEIAIEGIGTLANRVVRG